MTDLDVARRRAAALLAIVDQMIPQCEADVTLARVIARARRRARRAGLDLGRHPVLRALPHADPLGRGVVTRPTLYVLVGALDRAGRMDPFRYAYDVLDEFTDDERALAAAELDAWIAQLGAEQ
jgi:hypothetical protein